MDIKIVRTLAAENILPLNSKAWSVIHCLSNGQGSNKVIKEHANYFIELVFDDIEFPVPGYIMPSVDDVHQAIDFCKDNHKKVMFVDEGAISRTPALAYVCQCAVGTDPKAAIATLIPKVHYPNQEIIKIGADILHKPAMLDVYKNFVKNDALKLFLLDTHCKRPNQRYNQPLRPI